MNKMRLAVGLALAIAAIPAVATGKSGPSALNGVYRVKWTEKELVAAHTSTLYARRNHAVLTLTLRDGQYLMRYSDPPSSDCRGTYTVSGTLFSINFHVPTCPGGVGLVRTRWSLSSGQLRFRVLRATDPGDEVFWGGKPWKKIG